VWALVETAFWFPSSGGRRSSVHGCGSVHAVVELRKDVRELHHLTGHYPEVRGLTFVVQPVNPEWSVTGDAQLLESAVTNLLNNAFKYTRAGGEVVLRVRTDGTRLLIEVEDECGGIPPTLGDPFQPFGQRRGQDRTGLGLGLSIARKAVRAHEGDIHIRNIPGTGCVFTIDVPLAFDDVPNPSGVGT
jgi:signal transduction histidine kinase